MIRHADILKAGVRGVIVSKTKPKRKDRKKELEEVEVKGKETEWRVHRPTLGEYVTLTPRLVTPVGGFTVSFLLCFAWDPRP